MLRHWEEWKNGRMEKWKNGRMEEWKMGGNSLKCRQIVIKIAFESKPQFSPKP
jgi:hypothetical protein